MDIINVVHLFTFYSAIWENEGSTAKGKCAYFCTPIPELVNTTSRDTADVKLFFLSLICISDHNKPIFLHSRQETQAYFFSFKLIVSSLNTAGFTWIQADHLKLEYFNFLLYFTTEFTSDVM